MISLILCSAGQVRMDPIRKGREHVALMMGKCCQIWASAFQRWCHGDISVSLLHGQRKEKDGRG